MMNSNSPGEAHRQLADHHDAVAGAHMAAAMSAHTKGINPAVGVLIKLARQAHLKAEEHRKRERLHGIMEVNIQRKHGGQPGLPTPQPPAYAYGTSARTGTSGMSNLDMPTYAEGTEAQNRALARHVASPGGAGELTPEIQWPSFQPPTSWASLVVPALRGEGPDLTPANVLEAIKAKQAIVGHLQALAEARKMGLPGYSMGSDNYPSSGYEAGGRTSGYAQGGLHPGGKAVVGEDGPEVVDLPRGSRVTPNLMTIIRMLLDKYEQEQQTMGQPAKHYADGTVMGGDLPYFAFGTAVGGQTSGLLPHEGGPVAGLNVGQNLPRAVPGGTYTGLEGAFRGPGGNFNPNQGYQGIQLEAARHGVYNPLGSEEAAGLARDAILNESGARQAQAMKLADIYGGGDPAFSAYLKSQALANTQSEAASAYSRARADEATRGEEFARQLLLGPQAGATFRRDPKTGEILAGVGGQVIGQLTGAGASHLAK